MDASSMSLSDLVMTLAYAIASGVVVVLMLLAIASYKKSDEKYRSRIRELEGMIENYRGLLELEREKHKRELKEISKASRAMRSVFRALEEGIIKIIHNIDGGEVMILEDGTLVCTKEKKVIYSLEDDNNE